MNRTLQGQIFFREFQRLIDGSSALIALVILLVLFSGVSAYFYFIHDQLTPKMPSNLPGWGKYIGLVVASIAIVGSMLLILLAALIIEVRPDALYVQYYPIHLKPRKILYETISGYRVLTYRPIPGK